MLWLRGQRAELNKNRTFLLANRSWVGMVGVLLVWTEFKEKNVKTK